MDHILLNAGIMLLVFVAGAVVGTLFGPRAESAIQARITGVEVVARDKLLALEARIGVLEGKAKAAVEGELKKL